MGVGEAWGIGVGGWLGLRSGDGGGGVGAELAAGEECSGEG